MAKSLLDISPSLLQTLGRIITRWAYVEMILGEFLAALLRADRGALHVITANVSSATIEDWLRTLIPIRFAEAATQVRLNAILNEVAELRAERNALVHGQWQPGPEPNTAKVQSVNLARSEIVLTRLVTASDLQELAERISEILEEIQIFRAVFRTVERKA